MSTNKKAAFRISFEASWVLTRRDDDKLPVELFTSEITQEFDASIQDTSLTECSGVIDLPEGWDFPFLKEKIEALLVKAYHLDQPGDIFSLTLEEFTPAPEKATVAEEIPEETAQEHKEEPEEKTAKPKLPDFLKGGIPSAENKKPEKSALERIQALVGAEEFKELAAECQKIAPGIKKYNTYDAFNHRSYLISINSGHGLSTYLELFADLIEELGLFTFTSKTKFAEVALLPPQTKNPMENPFTAALSYIQGRGGKVVCIDISEWMTKTSEKEFRDFLQEVDAHAGENIVFFRVPFVEKNILQELHENLNDLLFIKDLSFVPFDHQELDAFAEKLLTDRGFTLEADAMELFRQRITEEKNDGRFYGFNTVRKVILEMIYHKQLHDAVTGNDDAVIRKEQILSIVEDDSSTDQTGMEMLQELVGMESIQKRVEEIIAQIEASMQNESLGSPCIHMRFVGNPGTGKTTVARIIGKILKEKGILRNGNFFEYAGRDFCGRYVGETAPKTAGMCRDAYGSVMFIDEAYSLYRADGFSTADYGREAIDTLIAEMENHRNDLMVIMAGYPDEMEKLMTGNAGLKSRMPYQIDFPNYSREQLAQIFLGMAKKSFSFDAAFEAAVRDYFLNLSEEIMNAKDFSNARFVRNLFERTWGKAVLRCQMAQMKCDKLNVEDFALAVSEKDFQSIMQKKHKSIGFI